MFYSVFEFQGGCVSLEIENAGAKTILIQLLLGWSGQGHRTPGRDGSDKEGLLLLQVRQGWRECLENPEESREECVLIRVQGECLSFVPGWGTWRDSFAQPLMLIHTHTKQTCYSSHLQGKEREVLILSLQIW